MSATRAVNLWAGIRPKPAPSPEQIYKRAAGYLKTIDPAVTGSLGHNQAFKAAAALVRGFNLSISDARPLLEDWNRTCQPPFDQKDLEHKLISAAEKADGEPGHLLRDTDNQYRPVSAPQSQSTPVAPLEPKPPVPDGERVARLFEAAFLTILEGRADTWLAKRGISRKWLEGFPNLGFIERAEIRGWQRPLENSWLIRVATPDGKAVALKFHREEPPEKTAKCGWLPFGTERDEVTGKPRHGYATLWPPPEWFATELPIFITEGELKTAAILTAGRCATSPTAGAGFDWTPGLLARLAGRRVAVVYDDDEAGHKFRDNTLAALQPVALELKAVTFGQKEAQNA